MPTAHRLSRGTNAREQTIVAIYCDTPGTTASLAFPFSLVQRDLFALIYLLAKYHFLKYCFFRARRSCKTQPNKIHYRPPPAPHQSPKSGLAARLARQSDDILLTETALEAVAAAQPLSPSALRCQVAGDKHARMERKKAARRRKRERQE